MAHKRPDPSEPNDKAPALIHDFDDGMCYLIEPADDGHPDAWIAINEEAVIQMGTEK